MVRDEERAVDYENMKEKKKRVNKKEGEQRGQKQLEDRFHESRAQLHWRFLPQKKLYVFRHNSHQRNQNRPSLPLDQSPLGWMYSAAWSALSSRPYRLRWAFEWHVNGYKSHGCAQSRLIIHQRSACYLGEVIQGLPEEKEGGSVSEVRVKSSEKWVKAMKYYYWPVDTLSAEYKTLRKGCEHLC